MLILYVVPYAAGVKLAAVVTGGQIYTSTDSGATWTARDSNRNWMDIASDSTGASLQSCVSMLGGLSIHACRMVT